MTKLCITLVKSGIGCPEDQRRTLTALGFKRLHQSVILEDTPAVRGMILKVRHLVKLEEAN